MQSLMVSEHLQVVMVDFFMADQLCSQVPLLRSMEYLACYYISGSYRTQDHGFCINTKHIRDLAYAVSFLPYYWRAMQVTASSIMQQSPFLNYNTPVSEL